MADTKPLAPTDAELDELRQANGGRLNFVTFSEFRTIARAVLARWGQPAHSGEPLTHAQAKALVSKYGNDLLHLVYQVEVAHGITQKGGQHGAE